VKARGIHKTETSVSQRDNSARLPSSPSALSDSVVYFPLGSNFFGQSSLFSSHINLLSKFLWRRSQTTESEEAGRRRRKLVRAKTGFSLIELTVVLALVAILVTLVMAGTRAYSRFLVRAEIEKLYMVCSYVKQVAQTTGQPQAISFNPQQASYNYENAQEKLAPQVVFGAVPGAKGPPSAPRNPISRAITFPNNQIIFHPTGIMQAGTVYISSRDSDLQDLCNTHALSCAVSQVSFLRRYVYDGGWRLVNPNF